MTVTVKLRSGGEMQAFGVERLEIRGGVLWLGKRRIPVDAILELRTS